MTPIQIIVVSMLSLCIVMLAVLILLVVRHLSWRGKVKEYDAEDGSEDW